MGKREAEANEEHVQMPDAAMVSALAKMMEAGLSEDARMAFFFKAVSNPYRMKIGDVVVESVFAQGSRSIQDCVSDYLKQAKDHGDSER